MKYRWWMEVVCWIRGHKWALFGGGMWNNHWRCERCGGKGHKVS